jgi:hypothetical protein
LLQGTTAKGEAYYLLGFFSDICIFQVSEEVGKAISRHFNAAAAAPPR